MAPDDQELPPRYRQLDSVLVKRTELLERVRANREEHAEIFEKSLSGWHTAVTEALKKAYSDARQGKEYATQIGLPKPEDHTGEYDQVVTMLEMSQDQELELSARDFARFVMDHWGWQSQFLTITSSYSNAARAKAEKMRMLHQSSAPWYYE
jgi:hypothetical protein